MDSYSDHARYSTLKYLKENRIIVIGLPTHTSHTLQPLDVSVFSSFKSFACREFHEIERTKRNVDAFYVANVLAVAFQGSHSIINICSGFYKSGNFNFDDWSPSVATLINVIDIDWKKYDSTRTLYELLKRFEEKSSSLL